MEMRGKMSNTTLPLLPTPQLDQEIVFVVLKFLKLHLKTVANSSRSFTRPDTPAEPPV